MDMPLSIQAVTGLFLAEAPTPLVKNGLTALLVIVIVALFGAARLSRISSSRRASA